MAEAEVQARDGWLESSGADAAYPPEPWFLGGSAAGSIYRLRASQLPRELLAHIPEDHKLVTLGGRVPVSVCFLHYGPGSVLEYDELLVAVPVRSGFRLRVSVMQIWVDSPNSVAGGRALWSIPKGLAEFERTRNARTLYAVMRDGGVEVAELHAQLGAPMLPGRWRFPLTTAQRLDGREVLSANMIIGRPRRLRTSWRFAQNGPLGWLAGRRPWLSVMVDDASIAFGQKVVRR